MPVSFFGILSAKQRFISILQAFLISFFILFILFLFNSRSVFAVGISGACTPSSNQKCDANLVCAAPAIGEVEICMGLTGATGCTTTTCAIGNVCKNGICVNDQGAGSASQLKLGEESTDIRIQINRVINIFLSFLAIIGVTLIIYAGILWATAGGNDEQVGKARKTMIAAAIGLVIIAVAWTVISYVINLGGSIS